MSNPGGSTPRCPSCNSTSVARLQVIYEQGTRIGTGVAIGTGGKSIGVAGMAGVSQSAAAQRASPPEKKPVAFAYAAILFAVVVGIGIAAFMGPAPQFHHSTDMTTGERLGSMTCMLVVLLAIAAWAANSIRVAMRFNSTEWPRLYKSWAKAWSCRKCGKIYIPDDG